MFPPKSAGFDPKNVWGGAIWNLFPEKGTQYLIWAVFELERQDYEEVAQTATIPHNLLSI